MSLFFKPLLIILGDSAVLAVFFDGFVCFAADCTDSNFGFLGFFADDFNKLFAALLGKFGENKANELAVVRRVDAEIGFLNCFFRG